MFFVQSVMDTANIVFYNRNEPNKLKMDYNTVLCSSRSAVQLKQTLLLHFPVITVRL